MNEVLPVIAGGILAVISSYVGLLVKRGYKDKVVFYKDMVSFTESFKRDMSFLKTPLLDFCSSYLKDKKSKVAELLGEYTTELRLKGKFERDSSKWDFAHLSREEKEELILFFNTLGKTSYNEQQSFLDKSESIFLSRVKKCEDDYKKKGNMYFKLFVLLGIALMVILW